MGILDELEFCHCALNRNLNELLRAVDGARDAKVLGCGDVPRERAAAAEQYAKALEAWLSSSVPNAEVRDQWQTVATLLGNHAGRKQELVGHVIKRLRDNGYEFYDYANEDFNTVDSRIQHLEICNFNWEQNLLILLDEIGQGKRTHGWHGVGLFCACGDRDPNNNYPRMVKAMLDSVKGKDQALLTALKQKLVETYP